MKVKIFKLNENHYGIKAAEDFDFIHCDLSFDTYNQAVITAKLNHWIIID